MTINSNGAGCEARQVSDQSVCQRCEFVWDVNDPDAPQCKTEQEVGRSALARLRAMMHAGEDPPDRPSTDTCPFCSKPPTGITGENGGGRRVYCTPCGIQGPLGYVAATDYREGPEHEANCRHAIARWNRRGYWYENGRKA